MTFLSTSRAEAAPRLASHDDRRKHQRVKISLLGRYMLADRCEYPCQTIDLSPGGLAVAAPVAPEPGTRVVVYLDTVGRLEGTISRHLEDGFALKLNTPPRKREKLADQLTWLANRSALGMPEDRRHERIEPRNRRTTLKLANGQEFPVKIIDVSLSGTAVMSSAQVTLGSLVTVGNTVARVVRVFEGGVALEFTRLLNEAHFDEDIVL
ncbi:MAG: PilZ domain-containing protein [Hyphomicrobiales bacterium]|nr:PilZ domain-containing protein [Hyphomicrobiales bacterium]